MITTPSVNVTYLLVTLLIAFVILSFHLQGGLERITKYMMSALIVLMLVLAVHSFTLPGAGEGLSFYLIPHFSKITGSVVVGAMNQAFSHCPWEWAVWRSSEAMSARTVLSWVSLSILLSWIHWWQRSPVSLYFRHASLMMWK